MKRVLVPAALTLFAATIVVVAFVPDQPVRTPVEIDALDLGPAIESDAGQLLARALHVNANMTFEGTLTVVGVDGPNVFQIGVTTDADGTRMVDAGAWLFGRDGDGTWASSDTGEEAATGVVSLSNVDVKALVGKYELAVAGVRDLPTGRAHLLTVTERATGIEREWLSVDVASELLVRRETFDDDGAAVRLVAFETLRTSGVVGAALPQTESHADLPETWNGIAIAELPGSFRLRGMTHQDIDGTRTIGMRFSDGLYRLSIYPQEGELDPARLDGATHETWGEVSLYRWPGAEPQRLVWSGEGHTFTAITDAPVDAIVPALSQFPSDPRDGPMSRMQRGLDRVAEILWPFD